MTRTRLKVTVGTAMALVAASALIAWFVRSLSHSNRLNGQRFALIGPIDMDRDGRDDRARLARMIRDNGGSVVYDLPPTGPAAGPISPGLSAYVLDSRSSTVAVTPAHLADQSKAIVQARTDGVRPITIDRLLARIRGR